MDLRVHVVGAARQHDAASAGLLQPVQNLLALCLHVPAGLQKLLPAGMRGHAHLSRRDIECLNEFRHQRLGQNLFVGKSHEGIHKVHVLLSQFFHVIFDVFRIGSDHGAVVVVARIRSLVALVGDAGVENEFHPLLDQPADVPVDQLGRVALGLAGDGLDAQLIELAGGLGRQGHVVSKALEKHRPEREVFVHVQHSGDSHHTAVRLVQGQGRVVEHPVVLVVEQVGDFLFGLFDSQAPLTAVAGDKTAAAAELVDGEHTVVIAALAPGHGGGVFQTGDFIKRQHGGLPGAVRGLHVPALPSDQRRAEGAHDAGDVGAHGLAAGNFLKAAQHGVVVKGSALNHHVAAQIRGARNFNYLK